MEELNIATVFEDNLGAYYYFAKRRDLFEKKKRIYIINSTGDQLSGKDLNPGWTPKQVVSSVTAGVLVLEKNHESALWFLDKNAHYISNDVNEITRKEHPNNIVFQIINATVNSVLLKQHISPVLRIVTSQFSENEFERYWDWLKSSLTLVDVSHKVTDDIALMFNLADEKNVSQEHRESKLAEQLSRVFGSYDLFFDALPSGKITIPCPFSNRNIASVHGMYVNNYLLAYYFETVRGPMILIGFGSSILIPFAAYFPLDNIFALTSRVFPRTILLSDFFPQFIGHVLANSDILPRYLKYTQCIPAPFIFSDHIGHHLWNELSGLSRAADEYCLQSVRSFYVLWPDKCEHYGRVEELFDLSCTVTRVREGGFPRCLYERRELCLRLTGIFVTEKLQNRLLSHAFKIENDFADKINSLVRESDVSFLVSFRLENRSWLNQKDEIIDLINNLIARNKKIFVAFDGHNATRDGKLYQSHEERPHSEFFEQELAVVKEIEAEYLDRIIVCNNIGGSVERSLILARLTDFFITPWGAALAKYKWAAGARGLIASNTFALATSGARMIYEDSRYVEGARSDIWFPVSDVVDFSAPEGRRYFSDVEKRDRANFKTTPKSLSKLVFAEYVTER